MSTLPEGMDPNELAEHLAKLGGAGGAPRPPQPALRLTFHPTCAIAFGSFEMLPPGIQIAAQSADVVRGMMTQTTAPDGAPEVGYFWFDRTGYLNMIRNAIEFAHDPEFLDAIVEAVEARRAAFTAAEAKAEGDDATIREARASVE
jgi:hypothetical protein